MLDLQAFARRVESAPGRPLFVTVSGANLYGFPSADSDVDLRGCHLDPLEEVVGLEAGPETWERPFDLAGTPVEWVSHEIRKYLRLLSRNNGYVLEQIFSPIVIAGSPFLDELRPLAARCITVSGSNREMPIQ
jgi:predicted nucleotidyltransferase